MEESESLPPKPPEVVIVGPGYDDQPTSQHKLKGRTLGLLSMALALSNPRTATKTVEDLITFIPKYDPYTPTILPCKICGQPGPDGKDFCSPKHATLYYLNQKSSTYKGDRKLPRSKRKKK